MGYKMKGWSGYQNSPIKNKKLEKVVDELYNASKMHKGQAETIDKHIDDMSADSPAKKRGLWDNIHAKRKRGEKMRSKGDKGAPTDKALKESQSPAKKSCSCWKGYSRVPGTKPCAPGSCKKD
jgi:hypothetical protein